MGKYVLYFIFLSKIPIMGCFSHHPELVHTTKCSTVFVIIPLVTITIVPLLQTVDIKNKTFLIRSLHINTYCVHHDQDNNGCMV